MADIPVQVKITADTDQAIAGIKKIDTAVDGLTASAQTATRNTSRLSGVFNTAGASALLASNRSRMLTQQFSQVAQQSVATGQVVQAFAIQAADIGLAFGTVGTIVGALAGVALPTLVAAFGGASDSAATLSDRLDEIEDVAGRASATIDLLRMSTDQLVETYGFAADRVRRFAIVQAELQASQAASRLADQFQTLSGELDRYAVTLDEMAGPAAMSAFETQRNAIRAIQDDFGITADQAASLVDELSALADASGYEQQQAALANVITALEDMEIPLARIPDELEIAINEMITLGRETDRARALMAELGAEARGVTVGVPLFEQGFDAQGLLPPTETPDLPRGGGRGRGRIDALIKSLQTETETIETWRTESLERLMKANEQELEVLGGHSEAKLRVEEEYQRRLAELRQSEQSQTLKSYGTLFGNLATAFSSGSGKLLKISKAFSVAQGLINSYRAYTEVLADPSLIGRPFLRTALAASTLASGLAQVANIKSVSDGSTAGGGAPTGAGGTAGSAAAAPSPLEVRVSGLAPDDLISGAQVSSLFDRLQDEAGDRGLSVSFAR
jgi:hypothetical protein